MNSFMTSTVGVDELQQIARQLRLDILDMTTKARSGHPSSSFSATEIVTVMYFGGVLRYRADEPNWPERDRFLQDVVAGLEQPDRMLWRAALASGSEPRIE